jgi:hypothetical protein
MIAGMAAGGIVLVYLWWNALVGWTWFALIGSAVTAGAALLASVVPSRSPQLRGIH